MSLVDWKVVERFKGYFHTTLRWWRRLPIHVPGMVTVGLPLLAIAISGTLALIGNYQRAGHFQTVTSCNDAGILKTASIANE